MQNFTRFPRRYPGNTGSSDIDPNYLSRSPLCSPRCSHTLVIFAPALHSCWCMLSQMSHRDRRLNSNATQRPPSLNPSIDNETPFTSTRCKCSHAKQRRLTVGCHCQAERSSRDGSARDAAYQRSVTPAGRDAVTGRDGTSERRDGTRAVDCLSQRHVRQRRHDDDDRNSQCS